MNEFNNGYNNLNNQNNSANTNSKDKTTSTNQNSFTYGTQQTNPYQNYSNNTSNGYTDFNQNGNSNEFSYSPKKPKKSAGKKILTAVVAVLCIAAVGTSSIVGYTLITGKNPVVSTSAGTSSSAKSSTDSAADTSSKVDRTNLPTLEQLATPSDAMSIPDIVTKVSPSVVGISCILANGTATGSGIIMSSDGYIITNAHVVSEAKSVSVLLPKEYATDNSDATEEDLTYEATIVGKDTQTDIAVLKIDAKDLTACEFGTSSDIQVGELSIVIGNPLGFSLANSVTSGIISATDRTLTIEDRTMNLIQTDASINSGNSGGPLINAYGQVIGITSAKVSSTYGEGLGFAIPIDEALPIIQDLMENGYVKGRPSLGVNGTDVTAAYSQYYGIPQGFLVASVTEGSGAEKAGVKANDIIIGINDTVISSITELNAVKNKCAVGDTVKLTLYRDGQMVDVNVELSEATASDTTTTDESTDQQSQSQQGSGSNGYGSYYNFFNNFGY